MMGRMFAIVSASALVMALPAAPALAQHGHSGGSSHAPATHGQSAAPHGSASAHGSSATHGSSTHGSAATHGSSHASSTHGSSATHGSSGTHGKSARTTTTTTTTRTTTSGTTTMTPVQQKLAKNTKLASKLQSRLPAGTDVQRASAGFRNLGQFVAAVNVSHNLGIPFADLKKDMVTYGMSLGRSIQDLKPSANAPIETERAERDADAIIRTTTTTSSSTTTRKHSSGQ